MSKPVVTKDSSKVSRQSRFFNARTVPFLATLLVCLVLYVAGAIRYGDRNFFTVQVFVDFLVDNSFLGIVAVGMTMVIITGGIDLSVGGVVALCSVVMAKLMAGHGVSPAVSWLVALGIGTSIGFLTGCAVRYFKIEPFIATLAGLFLTRGLALVISTEAIDIQNKFVLGLSEVGIGLGPVHSWAPLAVGIAMIAAALFCLFAAPFGRRLMARDGAKSFFGAMCVYIAGFAVVMTAIRLLGLGKWGMVVGNTWICVPILVSLALLAVGVIALFCMPIGRALRASGRSKILVAGGVYGVGIIVVATALRLVGLHKWGVAVGRLWVPVPTAICAGVIAATLITLFLLPAGRRFIGRDGAGALLGVSVVFAAVLGLTVLLLRGLVGQRVLLSLPALIFLGVVAIGAYVTFFTAFGRNLFAVGANEDAAHLMGLPVGRTKMLVYMLSGFLAGVAAIVMTMYQPSGDPIGANGMELDAIAVAVIGGTLLTGGAGNVFGTFVGVLIFGIIQTGITMERTLSSYWARVVLGGLLLVFVVLQRFLSASAYRKD